MVLCCSVLQLLPQPIEIIGSVKIGSAVGDVTYGYLLTVAVGNGDLPPLFSLSLRIQSLDQFLLLQGIFIVHFFRNQVDQRIGNNFPLIDHNTLELFDKYTLTV
jgi:hypothetical protein